jgi:hypothetical protein
MIDSDDGLRFIPDARPSPISAATTTSQSTPEVEDDRWKASDATRYLCVGAYLDPRFRRAVLKEVLHQEHRAVAPSYGIDIVPVLRHCLRARRREITRNLVLFGIFLVLLIVATKYLIGAISFAISMRYLILGVRKLMHGEMRLAFRNWFFAWLAAIPSALAAIPGAAADQFHSDSQYTTSSQAPGLIGLGVGTSVAVFILLIAVAWAVRLAELLNNHRTILEELSPGRFEPDLAPREPPAYRRRIAFLSSAQHGNVTYYARSATPRPFVGSGLLEEPWRLGIPLRRRPGPGAGTGIGAGIGAPAEELTIETLYDAMRRALFPLASPKLPEAQRVRGMSMQQKLFVPGLLRERDGLLDPRH